MRCTAPHAPPLPHPFHLRRPSRIKSGEGRLPDRFSAPPRSRDDLPGRRHRRRLASQAFLALAADPQRRGAEAAAPGAQGHQHHLHRRQPRRVPAHVPGTHFGGIVVADRAIHIGADGKRYLVIHGDQFDTVVLNMRWLAYLGDRAYELAILVNRLEPGCAAAGPALLVVLVLGQGEGEAGGELHRRVPGRAYRRGPAREVDGVICGHIHHAAIERFGDIEYINTGDWVESCTAVVEHFDGRMEIIHWDQASPAPDVGRAGRGRLADRRTSKRKHSAWLRAGTAAGCSGARRLLPFSVRLPRQTLRGTDPAPTGERRRTVAHVIAAPPAGTARQAAHFEFAHIADLRAVFIPARRPPSLLPALAGSEGFRRRGDRRHPVGADFPARRDHAADHRLADRARDRANVLIALGGLLARFVARLFPDADLRHGARCDTGAVHLLDAAVAARGFARPVGRTALRFELSGMRIWGSLTFLAANFFGGMVLAASADAVPVMIAFGLFATLAAACWSRRALAGRASPRRFRLPACRRRRQVAQPLFPAVRRRSGVIVASHAFFTASLRSTGNIGVSD